MSIADNALTGLGEKVFLTDGGLETVLIFHEGLELPCFAAFDLLKNDSGTRTLRNYYLPYIETAIAGRMGFLLDTPTWRASSDWMPQLGYEVHNVDEFNRKAVALMQDLRQEFQTDDTPMIISGAMGPRGDGYTPGAQMTVDEACAYHLPQAQALAAGGADLLSAVTMNYVAEAIGIARAAEQVGLPVVVGFTTETDGCLPDGDTLEVAINRVDLETTKKPVHYMLNCAHFDHFRDALIDDADWVRRIRAVRANASRLSHAELDECEVLDDGNPQEFGEMCAELHDKFSNLTVFGGCCGTDHRHVDAARCAIQ
jgi:S-methylmethionine-dependent homocysteine/selenocysteine methylase